jgi:hypothetical protein
LIYGTVSSEKIGVLLVGVLYKSVSQSSVGGDWQWSYLEFAYVVASYLGDENSMQKL